VSLGNPVLWPWDGVLGLLGSLESGCMDGVDGFFF
jgi:hypothetical protein